MVGAAGTGFADLRLLGAGEARSSAESMDSAESVCRRLLSRNSAILHSWQMAYSLGAKEGTWRKSAPHSASTRGMATQGVRRRFLPTFRGQA